MHIPLIWRGNTPVNKKDSISGLKEDDIEDLRGQLSERLVENAIKKLREFEVLRQGTLKDPDLMKLKRLHELLEEILNILNPKDLDRDNLLLINKLDGIEDNIEIIDEQIDKLKKRIMH